MTAPRRNRTLAGDLRWVETILLPSLSRPKIGRLPGDPARLEISVVPDGSAKPVVAQIMSDKLSVPLVARAGTAKDAIRELRDTTETLIGTKRARR